VLFGLAAAGLSQADPPDWVLYVLPLYVLAGPLAGGYVGLVTALRRETDAVVRALADRVGAVGSRALDRLDLPAAGVAPDRLRQLAGQRLHPPRSGFVARALSGFVVGRAVEAAGVAALRDRLLELADDAERRGQPVVARDAVTAFVREGLVFAAASRVRLGWTATRMLGLAIGAGLLLSLPVATALA